MRIIWSARKVLQEGVCWCLRNKVNILVFNHDWILRVDHSQLIESINNCQFESVADLIDTNNISVVEHLYS